MVGSEPRRGLLLRIAEDFGPGDLDTDRVTLEQSVPALLRVHQTRVPPDHQAPAHPGNHRMGERLETCDVADSPHLVFRMIVCHLSIPFLLLDNVHRVLVPEQESRYVLPQKNLHD